MRRLWSHIILAATSLLMVGVSFAAVVKKTSNNTNIEFTSGREYVFRINAKDDDKNIDKDYEFTNDVAVKEIAGIMEDRLQTADITRYKIETQGLDTLKVTFQTEEEQYELIKSYLTFDATLALSNSEDTVAYAEEFLNPNKKAYLERTNGYPAIVIPIDSENEKFKAVYEGAQQLVKDGKGEVVPEHDHEEGEEHDEEEEGTKAYLYLWYNYVPEYYSYDEYKKDNSTIKDKVLMTFDSDECFADKDHTALRAFVNPTNSDGETVTADGLRKAYRSAEYFVNLLNAGELSYYVTYLFDTKASNAWVEDLVKLGDDRESIAWSRTFIATLCAVVVVSLLLVYFYRLGALSIITASVASTFFGLVFIAAFGAQFNVAAIVGIVALAMTSITSGIVYLNKFKEECYRGRSLKKANTEAGKRALLPTIDLHVVLIAIGVAAYLFGGAIMKAFALSAVLGGLISLIINLAGLRGLMWLVTNEQKLAGRYDLFDISKDQVPNALEEEKQKYFGPNADKDYTKKKKPIGFLALILFVASIAGMITFGAMNKGAVYGTTNPNGNAQVYITYSSATEDNYELTQTTKRIEEMLSKASLSNKKLEDIVTLERINDNNYVSITEKTASGVTTVYYAYYRLDFDRVLNGNEMIKYENVADEIAVSEFFKLENLNSTSSANLGFKDGTEISLKNSVRTSADQPKVTSLILASAIGTVIAAFYLLLRYRLSRGLASLVITVLTVGISAGIFSFLRFLPVTSYISVALPFIALFSLAIGILYINKEREMVLEDRTRDNSLENRNEIMKKAVALSSTPMTIAFIMALYLGVNFFGFMPSAVSWIFLLVILGVAIAIALALTILGPCAQLFFKLFSGVKIARPQKKKKKVRQVRVNKSAEPEEAIFIGIND